MNQSRSLHCSFCLKRREEVRKLIGSPEGRAYVCNECIAVCCSILKEESLDPATGQPTPQGEQRHPLLDDPLASKFMAAMERWIQQESSGAGPPPPEPTVEFEEMYRLGIKMVGPPRR